MALISHWGGQRWEGAIMGHKIVRMNNHVDGQPFRCTIMGRDNNEEEQSFGWASLRIDQHGDEQSCGWAVMWMDKYEGGEHPLRKSTMGMENCT
jgi:hypothetical protein